MTKISILIAEDHALIRQVWNMLLNANPLFSVVATCESGEEAVELAKQLRPDVVLLDINLKGLDGFETTRLIRTILPGAKILAVSMHVQPCYVQKMLKMGAMGYVTKNSPSEELVRAIIEVSKKRKYICEEVRQALSEQVLKIRNPNGINWLTIREMEIIDRLKLGHSSKEIASQLNLSSKTIDAHRYNIMRKLKVKNTAALVNHVNN